jgi:hypothetical protein
MLLITLRLVRLHPNFPSAGIPLGGPIGNKLYTLPFSWDIASALTLDKSMSTSNRVYKDGCRF